MQPTKSDDIESGWTVSSRMTMINLNVNLIIDGNITDFGDQRFLRIALENLLDNAFKYSYKKIEMKYAQDIFSP